MFGSLVCSQCWPKGCPKVEVFVYKCPIVILMTAISTFSWDVKTDCKITRFPKAECLLFTMWICYLPFLEHKWRRCLENSLTALCYYSFKMMWQFHGCLFLKFWIILFSEKSWLKIIFLFHFIYVASLGLKHVSVHPIQKKPRFVVSASGTLQCLLKKKIRKSFLSILSEGSILLHLWVFWTNIWQERFM